MERDPRLAVDQGHFAAVAHVAIHQLVRRRDRLEMLEQRAVDQFLGLPEGGFGTVEVASVRSRPAGADVAVVNRNNAVSRRFAADARARLDL
jgi:hypothetical protein